MKPSNAGCRWNSHKGCIKSIIPRSIYGFRQATFERDQAAINIIARGPALAITGLFNAISSFVFQFVFPWEMSHLGSAAIFINCCGPGLVVFVLPGWLLPEIKGKSLEELELVLRKKK